MAHFEKSTQSHTTNLVELNPQKANDPSQRFRRSRGIITTIRGQFQPLLEKFARTSIPSSYLSSEGIDPYQFSKEIKKVKAESKLSREVDRTGDLIASFGYTPTLLEKYLFTLDQRICGAESEPTLLAAVYALKSKIPGHEVETYQNAKAIAFHRVSSRIMSEIEVAGAGLTVWGASNLNKLYGLATAGMFIRYVSHQINIFNKNAIGTSWENHFDMFHETIGNNMRLLMSSLKRTKKFSEKDMKDILSAGTELYLAELNAPGEQRRQNVRIPTAVFAAMLLSQSWVWGGLLFAGGIAANLFSESTYDEDKLRKQKIEIGVEGGDWEYVQKLRNEHRVMGGRNSMIGSLDDFFITLMFANRIRNIAAYMSAARYSLDGMHAPLSRQRARHRAEKVVAINSAHIDVYNSSQFLISPHQWNAHVNRQENLDYQKPAPESLPFRKGIVILDVSTIYGGQDASKIMPLSITLGAGEALVVRGRNGWGKSLVLQSVMHSLNHDGQVNIILPDDSVDLESNNPSRVINVHELSGPEEVAEYIDYFSRTHLDRSKSIVDTMRHIYTKVREDQERVPQWENADDKKKWNLGTRTTDRHLTALLQSDDVSSPVKEALEAWQNDRYNWTNRELARSRGALAAVNITPHTQIDDMSDGEQNRFVSFLGYWTIKTSPHMVAAFFDEPLAGVDKLPYKNSNAKYQIGMLKRIKNELNVATVIVSHDGIPTLSREMNAKIMDLVYKNGGKRRFRHDSGLSVAEANGNRTLLPETFSYEDLKMLGIMIDSAQRKMLPSFPNSRRKNT